MLQFIRAALVIGALATLSISTAQATSGSGMLGRNGSHNSASFAAWTMTAGGAAYSCTNVLYRFTGVTTGTATIDPELFGCQYSVGGTPLATVTVDTPCTWTLSIDSGTFNTTTGAMTGGTLITGCATQVTVPALGCTVTIAAQASEGVSWQNITASGANDTSATPWGSKLVQALSGLTYTATPACLIAEHGSISVSSTVAVPNLFIKL